MPAVKLLAPTVAVVLALAAVGCGDDDESTTSATDAAAPVETDGSTAKTKPEVTVPDGAPPTQLEIRDIEVGTGPEAAKGDEVTVQYVGVNYKSGKEFDSSWSRSEPFTFQLGAGMVIPGWDRGVAGMKVGGRRELIIPPGLAYGPEGAPPAIGPNETLIFVIDLEEAG
jgi:peptidylprolyl isomerase